MKLWNILPHSLTKAETFAGETQTRGCPCWAFLALKGLSCTPWRRWHFCQLPFLPISSDSGHQTEAQERGHWERWTPGQITVTVQTVKHTKVLHYDLHSFKRTMIFQVPFHSSTAVYMYLVSILHTHSSRHNTIPKLESISPNYKAPSMY